MNIQNNWSTKKLGKTNEIVENLKSETIKILEPYSWWVQVAQIFPETSSNYRARELLRDVDEICLSIESNSNNKRVLLEKVKYLCFDIQKQYVNHANEHINYIGWQDLSDQEHEQKRQIWDFINEIRTYKWLEKNGFINIVFLSKTQEKMPDMEASKDNRRFFVEVKTLHRPRAEENRLRSRTITARDVERNYHKGLKNKIIYFIQNAKEKFDSIGVASNLLVIYYELSIDALITNEEDKRTINNILGEEYFSDLEKNYNMKIIRINEI